jgi:hypothetical protein
MRSRLVTTRQRNVTQLLTRFGPGSGQDDQEIRTGIIASCRDLIHAVQCGVLCRSSQGRHPDSRHHHRQSVLHCGVWRESCKRLEHLGHPVGIRQPCHCADWPVESHPRDWKTRCATVSQVLGHDEAVWNAYWPVSFEVGHDCVDDHCTSCWRCFQSR